MAARIHDAAPRRRPTTSISITPPGAELRAHRRQRLDHRQVRCSGWSCPPWSCTSGCGCMFELFVEQARRTSGEPRVSRWPPAQEHAAAAGAAPAAVPGERDLRRSGSSESAVLERLRLGEQGRRHGAHPDRGGDAADGRARPARRAPADRRRSRRRRGMMPADSSSGRTMEKQTAVAVQCECSNADCTMSACAGDRVSRVSASCIVPCALRRVARSSSPSTARLRRRSGEAVVAVERAAAVQGRDVQAAARTSSCRSTPRSRTRAGRDVRARRLLRQQAGGAGVRLLPVPDAVHAGDERHLQRAEGAAVHARQGLRRRARQLRPARHAGGGRPRRSGRTCSHWAAQDTAGGWHFLTGDEADDRARDVGRRLHLSVGRARRSSSRTSAACWWPTPDGTAVALLLRRRVLAEGTAAGARRVGQGHDRIGRSTSCCSTAFTTTRRLAATAWSS